MTEGHPQSSATLLCFVKNRLRNTFRELNKIHLNTDQQWHAPTAGPVSDCGAPQDKAFYLPADPHLNPHICSWALESDHNNEKIINNLRVKLLLPHTERSKLTCGSVTGTNNTLGISEKHLKEMVVDIAVGQA